VLLLQQLPQLAALFPLNLLDPLAVTHRLLPWVRLKVRAWLWLQLVVWVLASRQGWVDRKGNTPGRGCPAPRPGHHMRPKGYEFVGVDKYLAGSSRGYDAIRGREQQLIDALGGVGSPMVGNTYRGVSRWKPWGYFYHMSSDFEFGNIAPYTGCTTLLLCAGDP
jgi:hypothetical protein